MPRARAIMAVVIATLLPLLTGCSVRTLLTASENQWDRTVLAEKSGVTFGVPAGWNSDGTTPVFGERGIFYQDGQAQAVILVGSFDGLFVTPDGQGSLRQVAQSNAASFGEFFFPTPGRRRVTLDQKLQIDGHPAHLVEFHIRTDDGKQATSRFLVVLGPRDPVFAAFLHQNLTQAQADEGNRVLETLQLR